MTKTALILVDIQNDYFPDGVWPVEGMTDAAAKAALLLDHARKKEFTVIHVRHEILSPDARFFKPRSSGAEIHASVSPQPGEAVVLKHKPNSFLATDLKHHLDGSGITGIVLAGAMSQMCIDATARAASDHGYDVTVAHDACAAKSVEFAGRQVPAADVHACIMAALSGTYANVVACDTLIAG
ncbi:cysteine hydrolase family protein [Pseudorhodobacter sp.]|uniref:cysteine hydrolase family protein n=1 Tax=Pseudorhodobacter sp. TaxID=1934400 RepID=UPI0026470E66|nr:cysteine hydrolase family protein [Pseudorhodobacter sp.]MDN5788658.1 cysteine hydrolase [Pseudorhodobacter sp.]